jgi:hypothetical protein
MMRKGIWVIELDDAQSTAMRGGKLTHLRFPEKIYEENFPTFKKILIKDIFGNMTAPSFCREYSEKMASAADDNNIAVGEGTLYHEDSYIERWNKRFPDYPYSKDLETTVVELTWNI